MCLDEVLQIANAFFFGIDWLCDCRMAAFKINDWDVVFHVFFLTYAIREAFGIQEFIVARLSVAPLIARIV